MAYHSNISVATCYLCRRSNLKLLNVKIFTIICIRIAAKYDLFSSFHNHPYFCYIAQVFIVYKKVRVYATDSNPYPRPIPKQVPHKNGPTTGLVCLVSPFSVLSFSRVLKCHLANQNAATIISLQLSKVMATDYLFNWLPFYLITFLTDYLPKSILEEVALPALCCVGWSLHQRRRLLAKLTRTLHFKRLPHPRQGPCLTWKWKAKASELGNLTTTSHHPSRSPPELPKPIWNMCVSAILTLPVKARMWFWWHGCSYGCSHPTRRGFLDLNWSSREGSWESEREDGGGGGGGGWLGLACRCG